MNLDLLRLLSDTSLLVLIWMVQLVIYPSFKFYSPSNLFLWHKRYTKHVTIIVLPLMGFQILISVLHLSEIQNWYTIFSFIIILLLWILTFVIFVPLHQSIESGKPKESVCIKLVKYNWMRTLLWTFLFMVSFYKYFLFNA